jgi:hypothetical protein
MWNLLPLISNEFSVSRQAILGYLKHIEFSSDSGGQQHKRGHLPWRSAWLPQQRRGRLGAGILTSRRANQFDLFQPEGVISTVDLINKENSGRS